MINIRVVHRQIVEVSSELLLSFIFEESRPPQKSLGDIDWSLNGLISRMLISGKLNLEYGALNLIATQLKVVAPKLLLVGMGKGGNFDMDMVRETLTNITSCISELCVTNIAFVSPDPFYVGEENKKAVCKEVVLGMVEGARLGTIKEDLWFSLVVTESKSAEVMRAELKELLAPIGEANLMAS